MDEIPRMSRHPIRKIVNRTFKRDSHDAMYVTLVMECGHKKRLPARRATYGNQMRCKECERTLDQ